MSDIWSGDEHSGKIFKRKLHPPLWEGQDRSR
jgi:hypothetical protein